MRLVLSELGQFSLFLSGIFLKAILRKAILTQIGDIFEEIAFICYTYCELPYSNIVHQSSYLL